MRRFLLCLAVAAFAASSALAQTAPNPVMEHYRAYRAALEAGDLPAAETEAEAALAASEARDGDGGRTAVLAQNLAQVRLRLADVSALEPAQRAFELANVGAEGVSPIYAGLVLGRAELAAENATGADRLNSILRGPDVASLPYDEVYAAAATLGRWGFAREDYALSEFAWSVAAEYPDASQYGRIGGYGIARTWQGAAILYSEVGRRGSRRISEERGGQAYLLLSEAVDALRTVSSPRESDGAVTFGTRAYGDALALRQITWVKLQSDRRRVPETAVSEGDVDGFTELLSAGAVGPVALTPRCTFQPRYRPAPEYPQRLRERGGLGAVILLMRFNDAGEVESAEVISRAGDEDFAEAVIRVAGQWSLERRPDSAPGCRLPRNLIAPITFHVS